MRRNMRTSRTATFVLLACAVAASAQPLLGVPQVNAPCASGPTLNGGVPDTVSSVPDADGFVSLFDGRTLTGWWENCQTGHSSQNRTTGGIWIADSTHGALYSQQASNQAGSVLMTNKSYAHYELVFDFWPTWGNDAGVFNRVTATGRTFQTGLDYKQGSSIAGAYGEGGYGNPAGFNHDPYLFTNTEGVITVSTWSAFTAARNPASFGCPATGCGVADWNTVWDSAGWNQIRIKFYGGLTAGNHTKMFAWFRRLDNPPAPPPNNWVPVYADSQALVTPANPIGLQIHGGSAYWNAAGRGTWYRNIRIRELDANGIPVPVSVLRPRVRPEGLAAGNGSLQGTMAHPHTIVVRDVHGRVLERFHGPAGTVRYPLEARGLLMVEVREAGTVRHFRFAGFQADGR